MTVPVALIRIMPDGEQRYSIFGEGEVRFLVVDERCPADRVFQVTERQALPELEQLVPAGSTIGSKNDVRHAALMARVEAARDGTCHLRRVR